MNRNLTAIDRLDDQQIRRAVALLKTARQRIVQAINDAQGFDAFYLPQLKGAVEQAMRDFQTQYLDDFHRLQIKIEGLGTAMVAEPLARMGFSLNFPAYPQNIAQVLANFHADQIVGITNDAIEKISTQLSLGVLSPSPSKDLVVKEISKLLPGPAGAGTIEKRAKRIIRTEVNRIHAVSTQLRMEQAAEQVPNLRKYWLPAYRNTRPTHIEAGQNYSKSQPIPVNEPFMVGGFPAMYPRDPSLPAEEVGNCRCRSVP
ncbi:MAG: hypothetical protein KJ954_14155, partial [Alphaproteobacteria bacterium]|nr:hypothetical protein [Alphaproteobacteria bacterium]